MLNVDERICRMNLFVITWWISVACVDGWMAYHAPSHVARSRSHSSLQPPTWRPRMGAACIFLQAEKQQQGARRSSSSSSRGQGEAAAGGKEKQQHASTMHGVGVAQVLGFEREGHTMLRGLIQGDALERLAEAVQSEYNHRATEAYTQKLLELGVSRGGGKAALAKVCKEKGLPVPTLQVYNLHRADRPASKVVRELATSAEMGRVAADLLGVDSVMLYQTAAFFKFAGEGETAWHSDLNTAPFDTNYMVTFWIALTDVPTLQHSPLEFASRSHKDFALPYWYTIKGMKELDSRGYIRTNIY